VPHTASPQRLGPAASAQPVFCGDPSVLPDSTDHTHFTHLDLYVLSCLCSLSFYFFCLECFRPLLRYPLNLSPSQPSGGWLWVQALWSSPSFVLLQLTSGGSYVGYRELCFSFQVNWLMGWPPPQSSLSSPCLSQNDHKSWVNAKLRTNTSHICHTERTLLGRL
jgi:hypothetical protein